MINQFNIIFVEYYIFFKNLSIMVVNLKCSIRQLENTNFLEIDFLLMLDEAWLIYKSLI